MPVLTRLGPPLMIAFGLLVLGLPTALAGPTPASARDRTPAKTCTPEPRSAAVTRLRVDADKVAAGRVLRIEFVVRLTDTSCRGDAVQIKLPGLLEPVQQPGWLVDADGRRIGRISSDPAGTVTATFRGGEEPGRFLGSFPARVRGAMEPGSRTTLRWRVGDRLFRTRVRAENCRGCSRPRLAARKSARLGHGTVRFVIESARARHQGDRVRFVDHIGPAQRVLCHRLEAHIGGADLGDWGQIHWRGRVPLRVHRCGKDRAAFNRGGTVIKASARAPRRGRYVVLVGTTRVRNPALDRYTDFGRVSQPGYRGPVSATARRFIPRPDSRSATERDPSPTPSSSAPGPTSDVTPEQRQEDESSEGRTPIIVTTLAILVGGASLLLFGLRRRSS